jgi:hypothetical protein
MSSDDDRTIERFIAGVRVDEADLAAAAARRAVDRTIVVDALVRALEHPEAAVRLLTAQRLARMTNVGDVLVGRLTYAAGGDPDLRVRAAARAALRIHRVTPDERERRDTRRAGSILVSLAFQPAFLRGTRAVVRLHAADRTDAPDAWARLLAEDLLVRVVLTGLPAGFASLRPTIRIAGDDGEDIDVATAAQPVAGDGSVTIDVAPGTRTQDEMADILASGFELVVAQS